MSEVLAILAGMVGFVTIVIVVGVVVKDLIARPVHRTDARVREATRIMLKLTTADDILAFLPANIREDIVEFLEDNKKGATE